MTSARIAVAAAAAAARLGRVLAELGIGTDADAAADLLLVDDLDAPSGDGRTLYCVATVDDATADLILRRPGAYVVGLDESDTAIAAAVIDALEDRLRIPRPQRGGRAARLPDVAPDELRWFAHLAAGQRMIDVARHCGYSERELYRRLRLVYRRLGVTSRAEAIALLSSHGLLVPVRSS